MNLLYRRQGYPEEGEIVLCKVVNVNPHSAFVNLEEYNKQGLIHISEISPGRIRNLSAYVKPDKIIVCKVLRVYDNGHIDLSLRRVTKIQRRNKLEEIKQEQTAERIIEYLATQILKEDYKELYSKISKPLLKHYDYLFECFYDIVSDEVSLGDLIKWGVPKDTAEKLYNLVKERIKLKKKIIKGTLRLMSFEPNGVEVVRNIIKKILDLKTDSVNISIKYAGSASYIVEVSSESYKADEEVIAKMMEILEKNVNKEMAAYEFVRDEK